MHLEGFTCMIDRFHANSKHLDFGHIQKYPAHEFWPGSRCSTQPQLECASVTTKIFLLAQQAHLCVRVCMRVCQKTVGVHVTDSIFSPPAQDLALLETFLFLHLHLFSWQLLFAE